MRMAGGYSPDDLDHHSQLTIEALLNAGGKACAGYIKEQVGFDQTQQVHYRCNADTDGRSILALLQFVEPTDETETWNGHPSTVYRLTDAGERYALKQNLDLAPELHRGQLEREIDQLLSNLDQTRQHAETANKRAAKAHERIDDVTDDLDGFEKQEFTGLKNEVDRLRGEIDDMERTVQRVKSVVQSHEDIYERADKADELEERVDELEAAIGDVEAEMDGYNEMDTLTDLVSDNRAYLLKVWERVGVGFLTGHSSDDGDADSLAEAVFDYYGDEDAEEEDEDGGGLLRR